MYYRAGRMVDYRYAAQHFRYAVCALVPGVRVLRKPVHLTSLFLMATLALSVISRVPPMISRSTAVCLPISPFPNLHPSVADAEAAGFR